MIVNSYKAVAFEDISQEYDSSPCYKTSEEAVKFIFDEESDEPEFQDFLNEEGVENTWEAFYKWYQEFGDVDINLYHYTGRYWMIQHHQIEVFVS